MKSFGRSAKTDEKPRKVVYDGTNGVELVEWSRDEDTIARFQYRPELPDEPARVRVEHPHREWVVVPVGSTISQDEDGNLVLTTPEPTDTETDKTP